MSHPETSPSIKRDGTRWEAENWAYSNSNLAVATQVNGWLQAKQSMFNCFPIHHIPYGLDTKTYQPLDSEQCRSLLEIPTGKSFDVCSGEAE